MNWFSIILLIYAAFGFQLGQKNDKISFCSHYDCKILTKNKNHIMITLLNIAICNNVKQIIIVCDILYVD